MDKIDILLIDPLNSLYDSIRVREKLVYNISLGIGFLHSTIKSSNYKVETLVLGNNSRKVVEEIIKAKSPEYIGIKNYIQDMDDILLLAGYLEKFNRKIILGGFKNYRNAVKMMEKTKIHCCLVGEAEESIIELLSGKELHSIKGLVYKKGNSIKFTGQRPLVDYGSLPPAKRNYESGFQEIMASRGCYYTCRHCLWWDKKNTVRFRSPEKIIEEIEKINSENKEAEICFGDASLNLNEKYLKSLLLLADKKNLKFDNIRMYWNVKKMDEQTMELVKTTGLKHVAFGIESGNEKIRREAGKPFTNDDLIEFCEMLQERNIRADCFFQIGLPGESHDTVLQTLSLLLKILKYKTFSPMVMTFKPFPGTTYYQDPEKYKFSIISNDLDDWCEDVVNVETSLSSQKIASYAYALRMVNYIYKRSSISIPDWFSYLTFHILHHMHFLASKVKKNDRSIPLIRKKPIKFFDFNRFYSS